jgi:hypothetical protein
MEELRELGTEMENCFEMEELLRLRIGDGGTEIVSKRDGGSERDGDLGFTIRVRDIV